MAEIPKGHRIKNDHEAVEALNGIGRAIGEALKVENAKRKERGQKPLGFGLFLFEYGEQGNMFWLSSADRDGMFVALSELIKTEGN